MHVYRVLHTRNLTDSRCIQRPGTLAWTSHLSLNSPSSHAPPSLISQKGPLQQGYWVSLGAMPHLTAHTLPYLGSCIIGHPTPPAVNRSYRHPHRPPRQQLKRSRPLPPTTKATAPPPDAAASLASFQIRACKIDLGPRLTHGREPRPQSQSLRCDMESTGL